MIGLPIQVHSVTKEPLNQITQGEVIKEGFPDWTPEQFVAFYAKHNKCKEDHEVTRIEFKYLTVQELPEELRDSFEPDYDNMARELQDDLDWADQPTPYD